MRKKKGKKVILGFIIAIIIVLNLYAVYFMIERNNDKKETLDMLEVIDNNVDIKKDEVNSDINDNKTITDTIDRTYLYRAATPQGFKFDNYMKAIEMYINDKDAGLVTDDAEIYSKYFGDVKIAECSSDNIKITNREDLDIFIKLR